jgi:single-stranded-DNA-specific exonuclease
MLAHNLLMERNPVHARTMALELEDYNVRRQKVSATVTDEVRAIATTQYTDKKFIFAAEEHFPYGVVGLIAGRIANEFHKPTCVMTKGATTSTGSFRSIPELNIIEAIEECAELLEKFGGHAQAAGMTIKNENMEAFYEKFHALVEKKLVDVVTEPEQWIDAVLRPEHLTTKLYRDLSSFAPFGEGNPEPVFVLEDMVVREARLVGNGSKHLKLSLVPRGGVKCFDAIGFSFGKTFPDLKENDVLDVAFTLDENTWNGSTTLQLKLVDIQRKEGF